MIIRYDIYITLLGFSYENRLKTEITGAAWFINII